MKEYKIFDAQLTAKLQEEVNRYVEEGYRIAFVVPIQSNTRIIMERDPGSRCITEDKK